MTLVCSHTPAALFSACRCLSSCEAGALVGQCMRLVMLRRMHRPCHRPRQDVPAFWRLTRFASIASKQAKCTSVKWQQCCRASIVRVSGRLTHVMKRLPQRLSVRRASSTTGNAERGQQPIWHNTVKPCYVLSGATRHMLTRNAEAMQASCCASSQHYQTAHSLSLSDVK